MVGTKITPTEQENFAENVWTETGATKYLNEFAKMNCVDHVDGYQ